MLGDAPVGPTANGDAWKSLAQLSAFRAPFKGEGLEAGSVVLGQLSG